MTPPNQAHGAPPRQPAVRVLGRIGRVTVSELEDQSHEPFVARLLDQWEKFSRPISQSVLLVAILSASWLTYLVMQQERSGAPTHSIAATENASNEDVLDQRSEPPQLEDPATAALASRLAQDPTLRHDALRGGDRAARPSQSTEVAQNVGTPAIAPPRAAFSQSEPSHAHEGFVTPAPPHLQTTLPKRQLVHEGTQGTYSDASRQLVARGPRQASRSGQAHDTLSSPRIWHEVTPITDEDTTGLAQGGSSLENNLSASEPWSPPAESSTPWYPPNHGPRADSAPRAIAELSGTVQDIPTR